MGALPNTSPRPITPRKPAAKAKALSVDATGQIKVAPRDYAAIDAEFRGPSGTAWTPVGCAFDSDRMRLASGLLFIRITTYITHRAARNRKPNEEMSFECEVDLGELAIWCGVNERSINREFVYLSQRDMAIIARLPGGKAVVRLAVSPEVLGDKIFPGWAAIKQNYAEWAASQKVSLEEQAEETETEESEQNQIIKGIVAVVKRPRKLKPGTRDKAQAVNAGVKSASVELIESEDLDYSWTAEVDSGEFKTRICVPKRQTPRSNQASKPPLSTTSGDSSGRTRPNVAKVPTNAGIVESPQRGVDFTVGQYRTAKSVSTHPRAAELCALFDPAIYQHCQKTLSGDPISLKKSCEAVEDTPLDYLVSALQERSERALKPFHVPSLLLEIRHNYLKSKGMPAMSKQSSTAPRGGKATFAERLKARAIENIKKTGRIV